MAPSLGLVLFLVILGLAGSSSISSVDTSGCQRKDDPKKVEVMGWPVTTAVQLTSMADAAVKLHFLHHNVTHTTLTLAKPRHQISGMMMVEMRVESDGSKNITYPVLVSPDHWTSVRVNLHLKRLMVVVVTQAGSPHTTTSTIFTTKTQLHLLHHLSVDAITYSCTDVCLADVDLECLQGEKTQQEKHHETHQPQGTDRVYRGTPVWPFILVLVLLLVVIFLYLAWSYQHQQVKRRRQRQANVASGGGSRSSQHGRISGAPREISNSSSSYVSQDTNSDQSVKYSTVLLGYNGPCHDDPDAT
ncbi:hypothetical protein Pmani_030244 [Petrolisthes manimaculis]|uniref:Uncharacterized protein n=1 Tax=Petrolisthes manimaculis TaxID=1843537 RepID=A0AAE1NXQ5_9EUCA|nr:hypothetical protein Pmani_030244 [Petrolisthes manimaculis]